MERSKRSKVEKTRQAGLTEQAGHPEGRALPALLTPPPGWPSWREVMRLALDQAFLAGQSGEVPVGAVILSRQGDILARAGNAAISSNDPTAHAEMLALRRACETAGNYRLDGAVLVVTLEPCLMCLGAMVHARIGGLVYGARDSKAGAVDSCLRGLDLPFLNHRFPVLDGVLAEDCSGVLKRFFLARRKDREPGQSGRPGPDIPLAGEGKKV